MTAFSATSTLVVLPRRPSRLWQWARRLLTSLLVANQRKRVTEILAAGAGEGVDRTAMAAELMPLVYDELRRLARSYLGRERSGHTLQPTALVHEAYLRLVDQKRVDWQGRTHFFAVGAKMMRRCLVDHARGRNRLKRGGDVVLTASLPDVALSARPLSPEELIAVDSALERLAAVDPRQAQVVELRFFAGLTVPETAEILGVSNRTVEAEWTHARAWLLRELSGEA